MPKKAEVANSARSTKRSSPTTKRSAEVLHSWKQVNQRLAALGEADRQIRALTDQFLQKMAVIKQQWLDASRPVVRDKEKFKSQIERFFWAHRDEMMACGHKSVHLTFGRLGSRRSRSVVILDSDAATEWLRVNGYNRYLRTRTAIDRDALRCALICPNGNTTSADASDLVRCPSIRLQVAEEFWYQVDDPSINRAALPAERIQPSRAFSSSRLNPLPARGDAGGNRPALELCASAAPPAHP